MTGYNLVSLDDLLMVSGEEQSKKVLRSFSCPINEDVEYFLHHKAIEFSRRDLSKTSLVLAPYKKEPVLVGYFTLTTKSIIIDKDALSKEKRKRMRSFSSDRSGDGDFTIPIPLIAQLGKNFSNDYNNLISGNDLLGIALNRIVVTQNILGGRYVFLECEESEKLIEFYQRNQFLIFARRQLDSDEKYLKGPLVRMIREIKKEDKTELLRLIT